MCAANSSSTVITGPLDFFTTFRLGDRPAAFLGCAASFAAWAARASGVQVVPVMTAADHRVPHEKRPTVDVGRKNGHSEQSVFAGSGWRVHATDSL